MKAITSEWVHKAEGDFLTAQREMKAAPANYDAVCFHAQQCAEKYIKARLVEEGIWRNDNEKIGTKSLE